MADGMADEAARARLGAAMREAREMLGISITEAARRAGIGEATWQRAELGQVAARRKTLIAIGNALEWKDGIAEAVLYADAATEDRLDRIEKKLDLVQSALNRFVELMGEAGAAEIARLGSLAQADGSRPKSSRRT